MRPKFMPLPETPIRPIVAGVQKLVDFGDGASQALRRRRGERATGVGGDELALAQQQREIERLQRAGAACRGVAGQCQQALEQLQEWRVRFGFAALLRAQPQFLPGQGLLETL